MTTNLRSRQLVSNHPPYRERYEPSEEKASSKITASTTTSVESMYLPQHPPSSQQTTHTSIPKEKRGEPYQAGSSRVADYFSVLGTGQKLIRQTKKKRRQRVFLDESTGGAIDEEDSDEEYGRTQRWYREIVNVRIVGTPSAYEELWDEASRRNDTTKEKKVSGTAKNMRKVGTKLLRTVSGSVEGILLRSDLGSSRHSSTNIASTHSNDMMPIDPDNSFSPRINDEEISIAKADGFEVILQTRGLKHQGSSCGNDSFLADESMLMDMSISHTHSFTAHGASNPANSACTEADPEEDVWEANLHARVGLRREVLLYKSGHGPSRSKDMKQTDPDATPLKRVGDAARRALPKTIKRSTEVDVRTSSHNAAFYVAYRRRLPDEDHIPALSEVRIMYLQLPKSCLMKNSSPSSPWNEASVEQRNNQVQVKTIQDVDEREQIEGNVRPRLQIQTNGDVASPRIVRLRDVLIIPNTFEELVLPPALESLHIDVTSWTQREAASTSAENYESVQSSSSGDKGNDRQSQRRLDNTFFISSSPTDLDEDEAVEAIVDADSAYIKSPLAQSSSTSNKVNRGSMPRIIATPPTGVSIERDSVVTGNRNQGDTASTKESGHDNIRNHFNKYLYFPVIVAKRVSCDDEARWHEEPGIVDLEMSFLDGNRIISVDLKAMTKMDDDDAEENEDEDWDEELLRKTKWETSDSIESSLPTSSTTLGIPSLIYRKNRPLGFCDTSFFATVLDRFPDKDYKHLPFLEEELPLFSYPRGSFLKRRRYHDVPMPECYSFVVKNERGDEIHVSALAFEEPVCLEKLAQLQSWSRGRRRTCIAHRRYWDNVDVTKGLKSEDCNYHHFDDWIVLEQKTICLISRYPFVTAFRRYLRHLHMLSCSHSKIPIERYISHLLLSVPAPKPGGRSILLPLTTLPSPIVLTMPHTKDLPLIDLTFETLFGCLDVPTVVTIVLGFLILERGKVILVSHHSSLVTDACELLRSLLFPFQICAPYVPRLTEAFRGCLDFPGAIFAGIHHDGSDYCLAAQVMNEIPEETLIVDLDTGKASCNGDRYALLNSVWSLLPPEPRTKLVEELKLLCRLAGISSGKNSLPPSNQFSEQQSDDNLDDRAVRDAFFRFFCQILSGYENFLVVPDADFLISGEDWFDAQGFVSTASPSLQAFLGSLTTTQLFQSFVQRRTEASDLHCMLLDECIEEYQKDSGKAYGAHVHNIKGVSLLLVDQCAAENDDWTGSESGSASNYSDDVGNNCTVGSDGDLVLQPHNVGLRKSRYVYFFNGQSHFPESLKYDLCLPVRPLSYNPVEDADKAKVPILTRSTKELEGANRILKAACKNSRNLKIRRCLWQLPKLVASHILGSYLLCVPAQVAQSHLTVSCQGDFLLRALGALRLMRHKHRVIPDEASYRAMIVACGRVSTDRRAEIVKLFGLLRQEGVFPNAVTLGQYTRAIAEGFNRRNGNNSSAKSHESRETDLLSIFNTLDSSIALLDDFGRSFAKRSKNAISKKDDLDAIQGINDDASRADPDEKGLQEHTSTREKKNNSRSWKPVYVSSAFSSFRNLGETTIAMNENEVKLVALWSRTKACEQCGYTPLDEEIQAGWFVNGDLQDGSVPCPRCGTILFPLIGYRFLSIDEALGEPESAQVELSSSFEAEVEDIEPDSNEVIGVPLSLSFAESSYCAELRGYDFRDVPPQLRPLSSEPNLSEDLQILSTRASSEPGKKGFVQYLNPLQLRENLERIVVEHGEGALQRDTLRFLDATTFFNLWWFCARFSLPLPLPMESQNDSHGGHIDTPANRLRSVHYCAFASWDRSIALQGCKSGAKAIRTTILSMVDNGIRCATNDGSQLFTAPRGLLDFFSLQAYTRSDWEHRDLSQILVELVAATNEESRDLTTVLEAIVRCNLRRRGLQTYAGSSYQATGELDYYRTLLYLVRYQCTSAFHVFFPSKAKACKGYHFWCSKGNPLPVFDRVYKEAWKRVNEKHGFALPQTTAGVSDTALAFRSIFGHII